MTDRAAQPILDIRSASLSFGDRTLWQDLDLRTKPGEFLAVLGANGSGKSSLLRAIVGAIPLSAGSIRIAGKPAGRGSQTIGYVPQRLTVDAGTPIKARNLVRLGFDGHRWGTGLLNARAAQRKATELLESVGVGYLAAAPIGELSGGELQRVRIAQALAGDPQLVLCDEPLAALDLASAQTVVSLFDSYRRASGATVLFITHDINAVLEVADRVLYLAGGRFRLGTPDEVFTSETLTELYGVPVEVFRVAGRVMVSAATDPGADADIPHLGDAADCADPHGHLHLLDPALIGAASPVSAAPRERR